MEQFYKNYQKINQAYTLALTSLSFDIQTIAPQNGKAYRNEMMAILSGEAFEYKMNSESLDKIEKLMHTTQDDDLKKEIAMYLKNIELLRALPKEEYITYQKACNDGQTSWLHAKQDNNYSLFKDDLKNIIHLTKKQLTYINKSCSDYDYLLDMYEAGTNKEMYDTFFNAIKEQLVPFIQRIIHEGKEIDDSLLHQHYDIKRQMAFNEILQQHLYVNTAEVYTTTTEHPFTEFFSSHESRITTHYHEDNIMSAIFSTIHEYGHALYGLQIDDKYEGTAFRECIGSAMHESQSRLLENHIGRSKDFWIPLYPQFQAIFHEFEDVSLDEFITMIHVSKPSLIRIEADELTYPLHILIRYELEKAIFDGEADIHTLNELWNDKYEEYLGVRPDCEATGILQDVHWSSGAFGYFPTYALGSAIAAQYVAFMEKDMDVAGKLANNEFNAIAQWLKEHIHQFGAYYNSNANTERLTGESFNVQYYIDYLINKYTRIYF